MSNVANARINTFGQSPKVDIVPQSEEPVFILTSSQLSDLITRAVEKAIQPLQDRIEDLEMTVAAQGEQIASLTSTQEQDVNRIYQDIAYDRQRISRLEKVEPQPLQRDRGEILRALLAANGGKMLAKEARQKMHLSESRFSELLATMQEYIDTKPYHLNKSAKILILK